MQRYCNFIRILLTTALMSAVAFGTPVKRHPRDATVRRTCAAAKGVKRFCSDIIITPWSLPSWFRGSYSEVNAATHLNKLFQYHNFNVTVSEAVCKCFNDSAVDSQKCEVAEAVIVLHNAIKDFFTHHVDKTQILSIVMDYKTSTGDALKVTLKQSLCDASEFTLKLLAHINNGEYYHNCK